MIQDNSEFEEGLYIAVVEGYFLGSESDKVWFFETETRQWDPVFDIINGSNNGYLYTSSECQSFMKEHDLDFSQLIQIGVSAYVYYDEEGQLLWNIDYELTHK